MRKEDKFSAHLNRVVQVVERIIIKALIVFMAVLLLLSTIELGFSLMVSFLSGCDDNLFINLDNLINLFGIFLLVLIGIELLDTIKVYSKEHVIHVEVVLLVAIIAVARKVIVLDFDKTSGAEIIGIAALMIALASGYFLIKRIGGCAFGIPISTDIDIAGNTPGKPSPCQGQQQELGSPEVNAAKPEGD